MKNSLEVNPWATLLVVIELLILTSNPIEARMACVHQYEGAYLNKKESFCFNNSAALRIPAKTMGYFGVHAMGCFGAIAMATVRESERSDAGVVISLLDVPFRNQVPMSCF